LVSKSRASCSSGASGQRMCRPPGGMMKSSGITIFTRAGSTTTDAPDSTTSWIVFMPLQTPAKRLIANACRPMSRMSCTLDGKNTGSPQALKMWSLWCGAVLLLATWSSPAIAITPPWRDVPAMLACLNTSEQRSTPGPLPYQMPNTPSYFFCSGYRSSCCVPQTAVAPSSSFTPGWNTMCCSARCLRAAHSDWS
jgi:hypothetical protein